MCKIPTSLNIHTDRLFLIYQLVCRSLSRFIKQTVCVWLDVGLWFRVPNIYQRILPFCLPFTNPTVRPLSTTSRRRKCSTAHVIRQPISNDAPPIYRQKVTVCARARNAVVPWFTERVIAYTNWENWLNVTWRRLAVVSGRATPNWNTTLLRMYVGFFHTKFRICVDSHFVCHFQLPKYRFKHSVRHTIKSNIN